MIRLNWWTATAFVLMQFVCLRAVRADAFLALPLGEPHPITCKWSCLNPDGTTYYHQATDYGRTGNTTKIFAAAKGEVVTVVDGIPASTHLRGAAYGNQVRIRHPNGYLTIYAHLLPNTIMVRVGDEADTGRLLGTSDSTGKSSGPHLHFEVKDPSGRRVNPYGDPPDYEHGCGPNALWATCPPTPAPPTDVDEDGYTAAQGDCDDANPAVHPRASEPCNYRDDNCDGITDNPWITAGARSIGRPCSAGIGACARGGSWVCSQDGATSICNAVLGAPSEERCNRRDDNCDGATDEPWLTGLASDLGQPCAIRWGSCGITPGVYVCTPDGLTTVCGADPAIGWSPEICDGEDNDCDGIADNVPIERLQSDAEHCGSCGHACPERWFCQNGACTYECRYDVCSAYCSSMRCTDCSSGATCTYYSDCMNDCRGGSRPQGCLNYCLCMYGCGHGYTCECPFE